MKNEFKIDWNPTAKLIEKLIKEKIIEKDLVKSGKLLNSIEVIANNDGSFNVLGEDYFKFLDEKHKISSEVLSSNEFIEFVESELVRQIEKSF